MSSSDVPAKMNAVHVVQHPKDWTREALQAALETRQVDTPKPGKGEVLIRVAASPINPSDQSKLAGKYNADAAPGLPFVGGSEGSGTVVAAADGDEAGAKLVGKDVGFVGSGAWADYAVASVQRVLPLPDGVPVVKGSSPFVNPGTARAMVEIATAGKHGAMVMSAAASALVKMVIRHAAESGVKVIGTVRKEAQVQELLDLGAAAVVVVTADGWQKRLADACKEHDARLAFDAVAGDFAGELVSAMPNGSEVHVYGALSGKPVAGLSPHALIFQQKRVLGFWLVTHLGAKKPAEYVEFMRSIASRLTGTLSTENRAIYPVERAAEALADYSANMSGGKVLIGSAKLE